jgi:polyphosphate:AMP phosphotransferase
MLETVDLSATLIKSDYKKLRDDLDIQLAQLQREARQANIPIVVVFEGWEAAGKGTLLGQLLQALDPRGFKVHSIGPPTEEERFRPPMWRFWRRLPARGTIAIFDQSWYSQPLLGQIVDGLPEHDRLLAYEHIRILERQWSDDGVLIVKFFLHISKAEQGKRFRKIEKDPAFSWKIDEPAKRQHKRYDAFSHAVEDMLRETSTAYAPWTIVPAHDARFAHLQACETLVAAIKGALDRQKAAPSPPQPDIPRRTSPLDRVDLTLTLDKDRYTKRLDELQEELRRLQHLCYIHRVPVVLVYEGWDAAGKGGNIRRLTARLDPRGYEVLPYGAPEGEEAVRHYLWRFWRNLPKAGHFAIFDRSWYGRVLVERVEGFADPAVWFRAYREINEFEEQMTSSGAVVLKFWLHISKEEQLARLTARQETPHKSWKITDEDWRNREKWEAYWDAASDMIERTSTVHAPWNVVPGNDKRYARVHVIEAVVARLRKRLSD